MEKEKSRAQILDEFKKSLEGKSEAELKEVEQEIIKEAEAVDKKLSETVLELPEKGYQDVRRDIQMFLDKQTVQWQYTQGMLNMYDFWTPKKPDTIPYPVLHSVLTTLGGLQFTGYKEWNAVVRINNYFASFRDKYIELTEEPYLVAGKHDIVMNLLGLNNPIQIKEG